MWFSSRLAWRALSLGTIAMLIAGCSGGGGGTAVSPDGSALIPQSGARAATSTSAASTSASIAPLTGKGNVTFTIGVTPKPKGRIAPKYVSPSTESLQILIDGANPVIVDVTPASPNCSPNPATSGSYVCTISLSVAAGNHVFTVTAYDQTGGKGNVLSTNSTGTVYVKPTGTTTVSLVLQGVVTFVVLTLSNPHPAGAATIALAAVLRDADHNIIVGPGAYDHPVTLTTTDAKNGPLSKSTLNSPADTSGITVNYDGSSSVSSITYSATASGLSGANVTPATLTPEQVISATGTGALATLLVGGTVYTFVPTSSMSIPTTGSLIEVPSLNGGGILTSSSVHRNTTLAPIQHVTARMLRATHGHVPLVRVDPDYVNPPVAGNTSGVTACSSDQTHLRVYCISSAASTITEIDGSSLPAKVIGSIVTDAVNYAGFSGGECIICGIVYDPTDDAAIISSKNGIEVYAPTGKHLSTTAANPSETFGYNPVTDQVFNPEYDGNAGLPTPTIDVIDIKTATRFTLTGNAALGEPDQGAVDSKTNLGLSFDENSFAGFYLVPIGAGTYNAGTNSFTEAQSVMRPFTSSILNQCGEQTGIAIDSSIHVAFIDAEYCNPGTIGAAQLPVTGSASPNVSSFAFAPVPNTPDGATFESGFDPHSQAVVHLNSGHYGVTANGTFTYLAVVDTQKLLASPRSATDATVVDPTYDLVAHGVVTFIPI